MFQFLGQIGDYTNHFSQELEEDVNFWLDIFSKKYPKVQFKYQWLPKLQKTY